MAGSPCAHASTRRPRTASRRAGSHRISRSCPPAGDEAVLPSAYSGRRTRAATRAVFCALRVPRWIRGRHPRPPAAPSDRAIRAAPVIQRRRQKEDRRLRRRRTGRGAAMDAPAHYPTATRRFRPISTCPRWHHVRELAQTAALSRPHHRAHLLPGNARLRSALHGPCCKAITPRAAAFTKCSPTYYAGQRNGCHGAARRSATDRSTPNDDARAPTILRISCM